jgi:succinylarginine dihydrolase
VLGLHEDRTLFLAQNPTAISAGAFHNDVVAMGCEDRLVAHSQAFIKGREILKVLAQKFKADTGSALKVRWITSRELSLSKAVQTYFFNSQWVRLPDGRRWILAPQESAKNLKARKLLDSLCEDGFCEGWKSFDLRQSMRNGGGPACLRLRIPLTFTEWKAIPPRVKPSASSLLGLKDLIQHRYPEKLSPGDLANPEYVREALSTQKAVEAWVLGRG